MDVMCGCAPGASTYYNPQTLGWHCAQCGILVQGHKSAYRADARTMPAFETLPADAPCLLIYDPSGKNMSWVRYGELRPKWASVPYPIGSPWNPRGIYDSLEDAVAAAIHLGYKPTRWAEYGAALSQPLAEGLANMSEARATALLLSARKRRRAELAKIFPSLRKKQK